MAIFWEEIKTYTAWISTTQYRKAGIVAVTENCSFYLNFFNEHENLQENSSPIVSGRQHIYINLCYDLYADIMDLIRNEKPVFATYRDDAKFGKITTSIEPAGEGEVSTV